MLKWIWSSPVDDNKEIELKKYLDGSLRILAIIIYCPRQTY